MGIQRKTYSLESYLKNVEERDIRPDAETQRKYQRRSAEWQDKLIKTIYATKFNYMPEIQLAEEHTNGKSVNYILNGLHRTMTLMEFRKGIHKISKSMDDSVVIYLKKRVDENGNFILDDNGDFYYDKTEFDLKGKYFSDLPNEMQRTFNEYQLSTVIFEDCTKEEQAEWVTILNEQNAMNASQKAFTYSSNFAKNIRHIAENSRFFKDCGKYSQTERENGTMERIVTESVMATFYLNNWSPKSKNNSKYINNNASESDFDKVNGYLNNLITYCENEIGGNKKFQNIFNAKNTFIFMALYDRFVQLGLDDKCYIKFLSALEKDLGLRKIDDGNGERISWNELDSKSGTKDKRVVIRKISFLERLMKDFLKRYLHISSECCENIESNSNSESDEEFIAEMTGTDIAYVNESMELVNEALDELLLSTVIDGSKVLDSNNRKSLLAITLDCLDYLKQSEMEKWFSNYIRNNPAYITNQKENYIHMKQSLDKFTREAA